jgi:hypothetical protein
MEAFAAGIASLALGFLFIEWLWSRRRPSRPETIRRTPVIGRNVILFPVASAGHHQASWIESSDRPVS